MFLANDPGVATQPVDGDGSEKIRIICAEAKGRGSSGSSNTIWDDYLVLGPATSLGLQLSQSSPVWVDFCLPSIRIPVSSLVTVVASFF